ncbi:hypothetical protein QJS83_16995 [Bdellovibrio sp. 22V]|uniref:hypothetical protein n=1 Tax=Bdellovibrio sp. 22V TaxID=3044166 RepID=UPI002542A21A|nr:hypothetical protein [Bdellovibrio sp. 22V]WII72162.1 hypothetical protein QJS83_16995 [Bdellovibrio sp. 22V]
MKMSSKKRFENRNQVLTTEWSCQASKEQYAKGFSDWSKEEREKYADRDCVSCKYFLPFNTNWGLCNNPKSSIYLQTIFEHFKCVMFQRHE